MWSVGGLSPAIDGIAAYHTAAGGQAPTPYTNFAAESPLPRARNQPMKSPPLGEIHCPVMNEASSEARNAAVDAISSG